MFTEGPTFYTWNKETGSIAPVTWDEWSEWFQDPKTDRNVKQTVFKSGIVVSTIFLGLDHRFLSQGDPIVFETLGFDRCGHIVYQDRYTNADSALVGHCAAVESLSTSEEDFRVSD